MSVILLLIGYLIIGILIGEACNRTARESVRVPQFNALSYLLLVLFWPAFVINLFVKH